MCINEHGQPIGSALPDWTGACHPGHQGMVGRFACLVSLDPLAHVQELFQAFGRDTSGKIWAYNFIGPFNTVSSLREWAEGASGVQEQPYFPVADQETGKASGIARHWRIQPDHGVIEIGGITFAPSLQRTRIATEAIFLMMWRTMRDLGYRRLEWKCDALNAPSRAVAKRFGFRYEGTFEQAATYEDRNRDTAWYGSLDRDWFPVERGFQSWLAPENVDDDGQQRLKLADLIVLERSVRAQRETAT
ncbi:GNAT family N-acetyltransferase [Ruegeria hyattellae]|uniref:GNAT family N-acetyltransferase n=1 Tax=Ruegeria hyattellae TaxID=3233337 RepID=UPI00355C56AE